MSGKIISVVNRKGGVGKTTLTLALADTMVGEIEPYEPGKPLVIAVDLDPQGSLTKALLHDPHRQPNHARIREVGEQQRTLSFALEERLRRGTRSIDSFVTHGVGPNGFTYSLLANDARAWDVERRVLRSPGETKLKAAVTRLLRELAAEYSYVFVDSPPGQTVIAEAAVQNSDLVLCPTTADWLSYWGLESFDEYLQDVCEGDHQPPARFVFTKFKERPPQYDPQNEIHKLISNFTPPKHYVTLLQETGAGSAISKHPIALPFDPRLVTRLEGSPKPGRHWPWTRIYTSKTQSALKRLISAVKKELGNGPSSAPQSTRPRRRNERDASGDGPQIAR